MKHIKLILIPLATVALLACDRENIPGAQESDPVEIRLTSAMQLLTRAAYTSTQSAQIVSGEKVYVWADEVKTPATEYIHAWELTADGSGNFSASRKNYPNSGNPIDVYALHGNFTGITAETTTFPASVTHTVAADQTTGFAESDLLYASATGLPRQKTAHALTFSHLLSKIEVYLVAGTGTTDTELETATVTIQNTVPTATLTLSKSAAPTVAVTADPVQAIAARLQTETDQTVLIESVAQPAHRFAEAVIVPQWVNTTHASGGNPVDFITVTIGSASYNAQINKEFTGGNKYTYNIIVNKSGITLTSSITPWIDGGTEVIPAK